MKKFLTALMLVSMLVFVTGCAHVQKATVIQAIDTKDIFVVPATATVHIPKGTHAEWYNDKGVKTAEKTWDTDTDVTVTKNGRYISDFLLKDIVNTENP